MKQSKKQEETEPSKLEIWKAGVRKSRGLDELEPEPKKSFEVVTGEPRSEWLPAVLNFYKGVLSDWELSADEFEVLVTTCDRLQRFHVARLQIEKEGMTFTSSTGVIKTHPLLVVEKNAYMAFLSGCRRLNLKEPEEKRPAHRPRKGPS